MFDKIEQIDQELFLALNFDGGPFLDIFFWIITSKLVWVPLYLFMLWMLYRRYGLKKMLIAALTVGAMVGLIDQTCNFFKDFTPSFRPSHDPTLRVPAHTIYGYWGGLSGTVSAHAAISFGIAIFTSLLIRKRAYTISILLWAILIAYSRIYSGLHYPLDIFFGLITGMVWALIMLRIYGATLSWFDRREERKLRDGVPEA